MISRRRRLCTGTGRDGWSMASMDGTQTGLLVVRIWREPTSGDPSGVRARITSTVDATSHDDRTLLVNSTDDVLHAVRQWLREYLTQQRRLL